MPKEFKRGRDPVKSLGLGYGNKPETKAWKILEFIKSKGEEGASLTEIQYYIWTELQGKDPDEFWKSSSEKWGYAGDSYRNYPYNKTRATRGHWNTALYGGLNYPGLLNKFCKKNPVTKKWVLERMPKPGESIFSYTNESFKLVPESLNEMLNKRIDI